MRGTGRPGTAQAGRQAQTAWGGAPGITSQVLFSGAEARGLPAEESHYLRLCTAPEQAAAATLLLPSRAELDGSS